MFVRWQKRTRRSRAFGRDPRTDTHWAAILAESQRIDGKPMQRHVAYLGGITDSAIELPAQRAFFWQEVAQQLDQLALPKDDRAAIEAAVEAKVPRLTGRNITSGSFIWTGWTWILASHHLPGLRSASAPVTEASPVLAHATL